jgi:hypothetical protein
MEAAHLANPDDQWVGRAACHHGRGGVPGRTRPEHDLQMGLRAVPITTTCSSAFAATRAAQPTLVVTLDGCLAERVNVSSMAQPRSGIGRQARRRRGPPAGDRPGWAAAWARMNRGRRSGRHRGVATGAGGGRIDVGYRAAFGADAPQQAGWVTGPVVGRPGRPGAARAAGPVVRFGPGHCLRPFARGVLRRAVLASSRPRSR